MSDPVAGREAEIEAVAEALVAEGCGSGWAYPCAHRIIDALDAVREGESRNRLLELRQKTVQLLEAIDAGLED